LCTYACKYVVENNCIRDTEHTHNKSQSAVGLGNN
jgi:hypothetical protein